MHIQYTYIIIILYIYIYKYFVLLKNEHILTYANFNFYLLSKFTCKKLTRS